MPIRVVCLACGKKFSVADQHAGKRGKCPACSAKITVPTRDADEAEPPQDFEISAPPDMDVDALLSPDELNPPVDVAVSVDPPPPLIAAKRPAPHASDVDEPWYIWCLEVYARVLFVLFGLASLFAVLAGVVKMIQSSQPYGSASDLWSGVYIAGAGVLVGLPTLIGSAGAFLLVNLARDVRLMRRV
jgi:DNA-directed RNA polymerase subunit RPC12/RpoP